MKALIGLLKYFSQQGKFWFLPLIFIFIMIGGLLLLTQGSIFAPFIYTLF